jgi:hypothetical protein
MRSVGLMVPAAIRSAFAIRTGNLYVLAAVKLRLPLNSVR